MLYDSRVLRALGDVARDDAARHRAAPPRRVQQSAPVRAKYTLNTR
jgi:hypothetical protein